MFHDARYAANVAVINETAVAKYFPNENPLGQRFGTSPETSSRFEIIGVVRDAKYNNAREAAPPTAYFLYSKRPVPAVTFEVRTISEPVAMIASIRQAVRKIEPNLPLNAVSTQLEQIDNRFSQERLFAQAYGVFGGIALLLASIGLFGLISYSVVRRTNEIGIRLALGAQRMNVLTMVMRESFFMVGTGLIIGLVTALVGGRVLSELLSTLLFGLAPTDAVTIVTAIVILTGVAGLASYLPARRASRVDPMVALRHE